MLSLRALPGRFPNNTSLPRILFSVALLFLSWAIQVQAASAQRLFRLDKSVISTQDLDKKVRELMLNGKVHGMGLAIFNKNKLVYKKTFGYKNFVKKDTIKTSTNFYGASLSKAVFAVLVMKLVEEGKLDLDKPLQEYLPKPMYEYAGVMKWHDHYEDLRSDTLYQKITARMCLDHTTGFANWRWDEADQKLRVNQQPGSRYSYSGEGLVYLQVVLERMLGTSLEKLMEQSIFGPLKMEMSSYTWQPRFETDYCVGHTSAGEVIEKDKDNDPRAASTLETTLDDYAIFTEAVLQNKIINEKSRKEMFSTQIRLRSVKQMGPLRLKDTSMNDPIKLGYGLGWGILQSPYGVGAFKEGHGSGFQHYSILFPSQGIGIVILTNSDDGEGIFRDLLEYAIGDRYTPWWWQNYIPYNQK